MSTDDWEVDDTTKSKVEVYLQFLQSYSKLKPKNLLVIIGDKEDYGNTFGMDMIFAMGVPLPRLCILKGGIDAVKIENHKMLRKGSSQTTVHSLLA